MQFLQFSPPESTLSCIASRRTSSPTQPPHSFGTLHHHRQWVHAVKSGRNVGNPTGREKDTKDKQKGGKGGGRDHGQGADRVSADSTT
ncbi:hypothetical protein PG985_013294 [Apiospora marii]|uniref:Uncharacterized protein n=1 Tax=Apiospora marii TaxID=335849 RepID=A0ABR1R8K7_9PEZI